MRNKPYKSVLFLSRFSVDLTMLKTPLMILLILYPLLQNTKKD